MDLFGTVFAIVLALTLVGMFVWFWITGD